MKMSKLSKLILNLVIGVFVFAAFFMVKGVVGDGEVYAVDKYVSAYFSNTESVPLNIHFVYLFGNCPNVQYDPSTIPGCERIGDPGDMNYGYLPPANGSSYNWVSAYPVLSGGENPPYYVWWYATYQSGVQCVDPTDGIPPTENPLFYRVTINVSCDFPDYVPPTATPTPTPPLVVSSASANPYCYENDSKVDFSWGRVQTGWNYEVTWTVISTGQVFTQTVGDISTLTVNGFSPGVGISWSVRPYLGSNIGPSRSGNNFTTATNVCGGTPTNTPTPTPSSGSWSITTSEVCSAGRVNVTVNYSIPSGNQGYLQSTQFGWSQSTFGALSGSGSRVYTGLNQGTYYYVALRNYSSLTIMANNGGATSRSDCGGGTPTPTPTATPPVPTPTLPPPPASYNVSSDCGFGAARIRMSSFSSGFVVVYKVIDTTTGNMVGYYEAVGLDYNNFTGLASNRRYRTEFRNGGSTAPANANGPIIYQADVITGNCAPPPTATPTPTPPPVSWDVSGAGECYNASGGVVRFNVSAPAVWYVVDSASGSNPTYSGNSGTYTNLLGGVYPFGVSGTISLYSGSYSTGVLRDSFSYTIPTAAACGVAPTATPTPTPTPQSWSMTGTSECWPQTPPSTGGVIRFNVNSTSNWYIMNSFSPASLPYTSGSSGSYVNLLAGVYSFDASGTLSLYSGIYPTGVLRASQAFTIPSSTDCGNEPPCMYEIPDTPVFIGAIAGYSGGHPPTMSRMPYVQWIGNLKGDPTGYYEFRITDDGDQDPLTATATSVDWNTQENYWTTGTLLGSDQDFDWNSSDYSKLTPHGAIGALPAQSEGFPEDSILYVYVTAVNTCGHADSLGAFCLKKDIFGWMQTTGGDVASGSIIDGGTDAPVGKFNTTFLQLSKSGGISSFRSQNWSVSDDDKFSTNPATFSQLMSMYESKAVALPAPSALPGGIYTTSGNLTYTGNYSFTGPVVIIVRSGNLYIENDLTIAGNQNGVVFMVEGDINIRDTVTRADGIYIAQNTFRSAYNLPSIQFTDQLVIDGAVYSYGGFALDRIIDPGTGAPDDVADDPGELINYQPKYLIIFGDLLSVSNTSWNEIAP
ncbi:hypothetical protein KBB41_01005 [Candidatus Curtissbacteria bacterium]|nr:hypothetical protein [Candidatus Curtissbacteria bacterium]